MKKNGMKHSYFSQNALYRMSDKPPELPDVNDYILRYKETRDSYWLDYYLHVLEEKTLNGWAYRMANTYGQPNRFQDIKQELVLAMVAKLDAYNPAVGTTLVQFAARDMNSAVHNYIRKNAGIFLFSDKYYSNLRKVNAIYYSMVEQSHNERVDVIMAVTGFSRRQVNGYVVDGKWFRYPESIEKNFNDYMQTSVALDPYSSPDDIVPDCLQYDAIVEVIDKLRDRDKKLLLDYLGIECLSCGRVRKPTSLSDIADELQLRDEQSVTRRVKKVLEEVRAGLEEDGWL